MKYPDNLAGNSKQFNSSMVQRFKVGLTACGEYLRFNGSSADNTVTARGCMLIREMAEDLEAALDQFREITMIYAN